MKRFVALSALALMAAGCQAGPPSASPNPGPAPHSPTAPHSPVAAQADYSDQKVDMILVNAPQTMTAGKTDVLTARLMVPAGTQVVGVVPTASQDGFTYSLQMEVKEPAGASAPQPLDVQIPFTPSAGGTYFFNLADNHRFAVQVSPSTGYGFGSPGTGFGNTQPSFLDQGNAYSWGAYTPGGAPTTPPGGSTSPSSVDSSSTTPIFGAAVPLSSLTSGAVLGNPNVSERKIIAVQGPNYGEHGQYLTWTGRLWTAGTGPIQPDIVQNGNELKVMALIAPADQEPISVPMPREATMTFSYDFQTAGAYRIVSGDGITLAMVTIQ